MFGIPYGFYTPVLILQAFCVYHAYKNNQEQKWFWLIIFFPLIGCLIYLYQHFYSRKGVENLSESLKGIFNSNYNISKLEKEFRFNDSFTNRVNLADAYVLQGRYSEALPLYEDCLSGFKADDPVIMRKLLYVHHQLQNYDSVIQYGNQLENEKTFKNSEESIAYAWALHYGGQSDKAKQMFVNLDKPYSNYPHRLAYAEYLLDELQDQKQAKTLLTELYNEFEHMSKMEQRQHAGLPRRVRELYKRV